MPGPRNIHASAVLLAESGVLILGESGAGKTTLALSLVEAFRARGTFARLVADDQLFAEACSGRLIATPVPGIAGLAEVYGLGPRRVPFAAAAVIDLAVRLVEPSQAPRLGEEAFESICGIDLARLDLPRRNTAGAVLAIGAWLGGGRNGPDTS